MLLPSAQTNFPDTISGESFRTNQSVLARFAQNCDSFVRSKCRTFLVGDPAFIMIEKGRSLNVACIYVPPINVQVFRRRGKEKLGVQPFGPALCLEEQRAGCAARFWTKIGTVYTCQKMSILQILRKKETEKKREGNACHVYA
jgi:hypothetical protein